MEATDKVDFQEELCREVITTCLVSATGLASCGAGRRSRLVGIKGELAVVLSTHRITRLVSNQAPCTVLL